MGFRFLLRCGTRDTRILGRSCGGVIPTPEAKWLASCTSFGLLLELVVYSQIEVRDPCLRLAKALELAGVPFFADTFDEL